MAERRRVFYHIGFFVCSSKEQLLKQAMIFNPYLHGQDLRTKTHTPRVNLV